MGILSFYIEKLHTHIWKDHKHVWRKHTQVYGSLARIVIGGCYILNNVASFL